MLAISDVVGGYSKIMLAASIKIIGLAWLCALLASAQAQTTATTLEIKSDAATQALLREAESRLVAADSEGAYALLSPREASLAGHAFFDYLLGVAALDSGRISEAIFSLQRSLAVEPRFSGAKMELARAYYESGNNDQARPLFVALLDESPPPGVRDVLNRYLRAIDVRPTPPSPRFSPYAELGGGHDSNANGSTDDSQFLGFALSPQNVETDSAFTEVAAGFTWTVPTSAQAAWYSGVRASLRHNPDADFVDAGIVSALTGFSWRHGRLFGRAGLDGYIAQRDGDFNSSYGGLDLVLGGNLNAQWDLTLGVRAGAVNYDDPIDVLDVDRLLYTLGLTYRYASLAGITLEAIGGEDDEKRDSSPYGNSKFGGRLSVTAPVGRNQLRFAIGSLVSDYDGLFFGTPREDTQVTTLLEMEFRDVFSKGLSFIPRVRHVDNDSDVPLYKYDRTEFGLTLRWMPQ